MNSSSVQAVPGTRDRPVHVRVVYECDREPEHGLQILLRDGTTITLVGEHEDGSFVEDEAG